MREGRQFGGRQSQGARSYQEDFWNWDSRLDPDDDGPDGLLVVLADGMGGHRGGAHASVTAVDRFIETFAAETDSAPERLAPERLADALARGNEQIAIDSAAHEELEGMGCTLVAVAVDNGALHWISVGDSPLWLLREGRLRRLNDDHSMAPLLREQVEAGELTAEEAASHPQRNALRSALVGDPIALVDSSEDPLTLRPGDRVLLASDGVETLSVEEVETVARSVPEADSETLAEVLLEAVDAKQRRGQDNTTVVVITPFLGDEKPRRRRRWVPLILALVILGAIVAAGWYLFAASGPGESGPATIKLEGSQQGRSVAPADGARTPGPTNDAAKNGKKGKDARNRKAR